MRKILISYQKNVDRLLEGYFKTIRIIFLYQIQNKFVPKENLFVLWHYLGQVVDRMGRLGKVAVLGIQ